MKILVKLWKDIMALDGIFLHHIKKEIEDRVLGGRVDKIYQPNRDELVFSFRTMEGSHKLLLSARPGTARVHFTQIALENPKQPPMLCMLLRKKLQSAKLIAVRQQELERVLCLDFDAVNELGDHVTITVAAEIMGKYSNIILVGEDGKIIEALKRVDAEMSSERLVFPGLIYRDPPPQDKLSIITHTPEEIISKIENLPKSMSLSKALMEVLQGISPVISRELEFITGKGHDMVTTEMSWVDFDRLRLALRDLKLVAENSTGGAYTVIDERGKPKDFAFMNINQYGRSLTVNKEDSFSQLLDNFYAERDRIERMKVKSNDLLKILSNRSERLSRKINHQKAELLDCANKDEARIKGDLINSNLYAIQKSADKVELINYYDENCPVIEIKLDPSITASQNAQKYYKDYRKSKTAEIKLAEQIELGAQELEYIESVFYALTEARTEQDLAEIRAELADQGYVKSRQKNSKNPKKAKVQQIGKPLKFETSDGFTVLVGRNNKQNDKLTMKDSSNNDIWFHTKDIPGSHTILVLEGKEPTDTAMTEAARLAAIHSKAKDSSQVPVDYTKVRHVSKPQGAKPGMVIYVNYKTLYINL